MIVTTYSGAIGKRDGQVVIRLVQAQSDEHWRLARQLIEEYTASLNLDLSFQNLVV